MVVSHIILNGRIHSHLCHPVAKVKFVNIDFTAFASEVHVSIATEQLHLHRRVAHVVDYGAPFEQHLIINSKHGVKLLELSAHILSVDAAEYGTVLSTLQRQLHVVGVTARLREVNVLSCQFYADVALENCRFVV